MTGEVTLRGRVMPIGGLREKTMGALRAGIRTVILRRRMKKDLDEIDPNVRAKLRFVPVETVDAVFAEALVYPEAAPAARLDTECCRAAAEAVSYPRCGSENQQKRSDPLWRSTSTRRNLS